MPIVRATIRRRTVNGKPEDDIVNVLHYHVLTSFGVTEANLLVNKIGVFFDALAPYTASQISRATNAHLLQFAVVTPGGPGAGDDASSAVMFETEWDSTPQPAGSGQDLPSEVAICLSYRGVIAGLAEEENGGLTRPRARKRGRMYLGPWRGNVLSTNADGSRVTPSGAIIGVILDAYEAMIDGLDDGLNPIRHVVYSPTNGDYAAIVAAWIDDAMDTMRSRGEAPESRTERVIDQVA